MADPKDTADALVEEGLQLYKAGHLDDALDKWVAALDLVEDHKQALEYYAYVERNRDALEESFQQAADYTGDKVEMSDGAADDADVEFERERASFAGGQATPLPDGHGNYKPESHIQDPAQLQSLGEDDATPIVELPREEKTSRIGREELEVHLDESRKAEEIAAAAAKNFSTQEPTPEVGGLPHILLEEAAEDEEGSHTGSGSQIELATRGIGGNMATGASKPPDDDDDELVLLSDDDDYASEMDIAEDGPEFTWEEEASVKADGGAPPQGLQIDLSPDSSEEEALEVEDSSVVKSSPSDLLDFGENPSFKEDSGYQEVLLGGDMETSGSAPDIPELPNIPVSTPFEGLQDSSEDKSWVKEELERVDTAQGLNKDLPELDSDGSLSDMPLDSLEILSDGASGGPLLEIQGLLNDGNLEGALSSCGRILVDMPEDKKAKEKLAEIQEQLMEVYRQRIGDENGVPTVLVPRHEIVWQNLDYRTGFLLSRIDGFLSYQDIIDVSGMSDFEAYRIIVGLMDEEIIGIN